MSKDNHDRLVLNCKFLLIILLLVSGGGVWSGKPFGLALLDSMPFFLGCVVGFLNPVVFNYIFKRFPRLEKINNNGVGILLIVLEFVLPERFKAWERGGLIWFVTVVSILTTFATFRAGFVAIFWGLFGSVLLGLIIWMMMSVLDSAEEARKKRKQAKKMR